MSETQPEEKFIETDRGPASPKTASRGGRVFYYQDRSFPGKLTIVFLHGLSSNHTTWVNIMAKLHEEGYNSLALDLRGHGHSDKRKRRANYRLQILSDDLAQILNHEGLQQVILVGYSFGGYVAMDFIKRYPDRVRGLVLISTNFTSVLEYKHILFLRPLGVAIAYLLSGILFWQFRRRYIYFQHRASTGYWHSLWIGLNTMPLTVNAWFIIECGRINFRDSLGLIKVPVTLVRAKDDPFLTKEEAEDMHRLILGSKLITSQNPSHFLAAHAQDELSQIIFDFLNTI